ncbi:MAG: hypothetical protein RMK74_17420, partial [Myxococcales bacterium]|nr:hypothetical protein [Myxococcales bacterium]
GLSQIRAGELKLQGNEGLADQVSGRGQVYAAGVGMVATYFRRSAEQSDATAANYQQLASEAQARADDAREAAERAERRRDRIVSLYEDMQRLTHETRIAQIKG